MVALAALIIRELAVLAELQAVAQQIPLARLVFLLVIAEMEEQAVLHLMAVLAALLVFQ